MVLFFKYTSAFHILCFVYIFIHLLLIFCLCLEHVEEVPRPGSKPRSQQWQHGILHCQATRELHVLFFCFFLGGGVWCGLYQQAFIDFFLTVTSFMMRRILKCKRYYLCFTWNHIHQINYKSRNHNFKSKDMCLSPDGMMREHLDTRQWWTW